MSTATRTLCTATTDTFATFASSRRVSLHDSHPHQARPLPLRLRQDRQAHGVPRPRRRPLWLSSGREYVRREGATPASEDVRRCAQDPRGLHDLPLAHRRDVHCDRGADEAEPAASASNRPGDSRESHMKRIVKPARLPTRVCAFCGEEKYERHHRRCSNCGRTKFIADKDQAKDARAERAEALYGDWMED